MLQPLDILLLIPMVWGGYKGAARGLISGIFSVITLVLPLLGSMQLLDTTVRLLGTWYGDQHALLPYVALVLLYGVILIVVTWLEQLLKHLLQPTLMGKLDRLLGGLLGVFKWGMYSSLFLWIIGTMHLSIPTVYTKDTWIFPVIKALYPYFLACCSA